MSACEACWAEATRRAAYSPFAVEDMYPKVFREWNGVANSLAEPCGGVSVNGADPKCCEVHLLPWGHKQRHPHNA